MPARVSPASIIAGLALCVFPGTTVSRADSWPAPAPFEISSADSRFVARLEPSTDFGRGQPAHAEIFKLAEGVRVPQWKTTLVNRISPVSALLSDDGEHLVTFDNHYSLGYGDNVVVFYGRQGRLRQYSLEQVLADIPVGRWDVTQSVSSRRWHEHSITIVDGAGKEARLGLWIGWAARWFVWQLADGTTVKLTPDELQHWSERGARWAHERLASSPDAAGKPSPEQMRQWTAAATEWSRREGQRFIDQQTACKFLTYSKDPKDRALLEALLDDQQMDDNSEYVLRKLADRGLAIQDGIARDFKSAFRASDQRFYRLGTLTLTVQTPRPPDKDQGQMYVSIFPESVNERDWRQAKAAFRGGMGFRWKTSQDATIKLYAPPPLKPGRYWAKVVWDRGASHAFDLNLLEGMKAWRESREPAPEAGPGDLESGREWFEVKAGARTEVTVKLTAPL